MLLLFFRGTNSASKVWLGGGGFAWSSNHDKNCGEQNKNFGYVGELNAERIIPIRRASQGIVQIVPEIPLLQKLQRWTPGPTDRRLNFSGECL